MKKKKIYIYIYIKTYKKDLLEDLKMSLLSFKFVIIYLIYKMSRLLKNHLNLCKHLNIAFSNAF